MIGQVLHAQLGIPLGPAVAGTGVEAGVTGQGGGVGVVGEAIPTASPWSRQPALLAALAAGEQLAVLAGDVHRPLVPCRSRVRLDLLGILDGDAAAQIDLVGELGGRSAPMPSVRCRPVRITLVGSSGSLLRLLYISSR